MENVGEIYNLVARKYHDFYFNKVFFSEVLDHLSTLIDRNARILDLGTGSGTALNYLAKKGFTNLVGIDVSEVMLELGKEKVSIATFYNCDIREIECSEEFEAILSFFALCHLPKEDLPNIFSRIKKALKTNGYLVLGLTQGEGTISCKDYLGSSKSIPYSMFQEEELREYVTRSGIEVLEVKTQPYEDELFGKEIELYLIAKKTN
jgi:cyclopropane fatty-acyl-phospholipid synthase-like methyltransferase